jgi:DNA-binding response OmpR family regulator
VLPLDRSPTVLVVEDDPELRETFRVALTVAGYAVVAVEDGVDALRRVEAGIPDLVVLDLLLPRLPGRDVHQELASRPDTRRVPIVVVTGSDTSDLELQTFACVLRKPVEPDTLVATIEACLRRRRRP